MAQADQVSAPPAASDDNRMEDETNNTSGAPAAASNTTMDSELTSDKGAITYEDKLNQIKEALTTHSVPVQEGENWYVVDAKWLASFFDEASRMSPGPIDNSHLVDETSDGIYRVKDEVQEQQDYDLVPEEIWNLFQSWFGGGPAIPRKSVIQNPEAFKISYTVEVRPCEISVALQSTSSHLEWVDFEFSKNATIKQVMDQVKRDFNIQSRECKLWKTIYNSPHEEVDLSAVEDQTLEHALERKTGQRFIVEVGPNWIIEPPVSESSNNAIRSMTTNKIQISGTTAQQKKKYDSAPPGVCGLSNLGNTCFMNSGLQCLTHAPVLYRYFLENDYSKEINETNPLGMGGAVALAFGALMKEMWSGENSYFSPNDFKRVIGKYAPQFAGYQQQDSQELISFILDGLHEDLNRIQKKPATNPVEAKGREDAVVAQESWEVHKLRNDSIIVDKFQGQLKSTLHCPKCENFSIIFDPFMYLSLPIPIEKNRLINIMVFSNSTLNNEVESTLDADLSKLSNMPTRLTCKVTKTGSVSQLRDTVLELLGLNPNEDHDRCVLYEIFSNKVYKYLSDGDSISNILDSDTIHCQILPKASETTVDSKFVTSGKGIEKLNNLPKNVHSLYRQTYSNTQLQLPFLQVSLSSHITDRYGRKSFQIIGAPFVIPLGQIFEEKKEDQEVNVPTHEDLYEYCFHYMLRYVKDEFVAEIEQNMKERSLTFKDFLPSKEKLEGLKAGENIEENLSMFYLFDQEGSRFEVSERSFDGALLCDETEFKPYAPKYSSPRTEKKSIYMHIPSFFHDKMLDYEKLPRFKEHPSTKQKISQSEAINIYQCLDLYTSKEKLGANDTWYCPNCKEHVEATKKFDIWKVPDVLVIHLKRFSFSTYSRDKIDRFIDYPIQDLDISSFVHCKDLNLKYDLFAVSDHFGGLGGGHYTACAKNHVDGKWYKFDDSRSSEVHNPESIKASSNYVLFYIRKE